MRGHRPGSESKWFSINSGPGLYNQLSILPFMQRRQQGWAMGNRCPSLGPSSLTVTTWGCVTWFPLPHRTSLSIRSGIQCVVIYVAPPHFHPGYLPPLQGYRGGEFTEHMGLSQVWLNYWAKQEWLKKHWQTEAAGAGVGMLPHYLDSSHITWDSLHKELW